MDYGRRFGALGAVSYLVEHYSQVSRTILFKAGAQVSSHRVNFEQIGPKLLVSPFFKGFSSEGGSVDPILLYLVRKFESFLVDPGWAALGRPRLRGESLL